MEGQEHINIDTAKVIGSLERGFLDLSILVAEMRTSFADMKRDNSISFDRMEQGNTKQHGDLEIHYRSLRRRMSKFGLRMDKLEGDFKVMNGKLEGTGWERILNKSLVGVLLLISALYGDLQTGGSIHKYATKALTGIAGK